MKVEKINNNKVKITLTFEELEKREVNIKDIEKNSEIAKNLFVDLIEESNIDEEFEFEDSQLLIEATSDNNNLFIVTITKVDNLPDMKKYSLLEKKVKELEKLRVHPKDLSENQYILEKLSSLYEEAPTYLREPLSNSIKAFSMLLEEQDPRKIKKYRKYIESFIRDYEYYDPFEEEFSFDHFEENWDDDSNEEDDDFTFFTPSGGGNPWTS